MIDGAFFEATDVETSLDGDMRGGGGGWGVWCERGGGARGKERGGEESGERPVKERVKRVAKEVEWAGGVKGEKSQNLFRILILSPGRIFFASSFLGVQKDFPVQKFPSLILYLIMNHTISEIETFSFIFLFSSSNRNGNLKRFP